MNYRNPKFGFLLATVGLAACLPSAGDPSIDRNKDGIQDNVAGVRGVDEVLQFAPTSPSITVYGALHDAYTGEPIANQQITILTSRGVQLTGATNDTGGFQISAVSPGSFVFNATAEGHMPHRAVLAAAAPVGGNTDNTNQYIGKIYLFPVDSTWSFSAYTEDGRPVANAPIYVDVPTSLVDSRTHNGAGGIDLGNGSQATGFKTVVATTNAAGVAQVTGVPDLKKLFQFRDGNIAATRFVAAWVGTADLDNDGVMDATGSFKQWTAIEFFDSYGKVALPPLNTLLENATLQPVGTRAGNIIIDGVAANTISRYVGTSEPLVIIWNQPVDPATADFTVLNDWGNNRNGVGGALDDSTPVVNGQGFPIAKAAYQTKPATGTPTLVAAIDPSGTILTLTPTVPWQAGAEYIVTGQITSSRHNTNQTPHTYFFKSRGTGFHTAPSAPLGIATIFIERNDAGDNYGNIVVQLSEVVQAYMDDPAGNPYILVCADQDFGVNGRITTQANGVTSLDQGECPPAGYQLRTPDIGVGLVKARLREPSAQTKTAAGRFFEIAPSAINSLISGKSAVNLRVYVNPIVDGQPWGGLVSTVNPSTAVQNFLSNMVGNSFSNGVLSRDVTLAPLAGAVLELPTNNPPQFQ